MTLKEELEILRGEPIKVCEGDPMDIPSIETSDSERLCKHPVVSVHMLAYNHEPYIRQAIESVMMQKTDFEFELVIGEDCSQDKTREICFEFQKKYPDKIRVLWWHENLGKVGHHAGRNAERTTAHCRGEFIAFCEGDDYWTDPLKLQKQVDVMRTHPDVGFCFCNARIVFLREKREIEWNQSGTWSAGLVSNKEFFLKHLFGTAAAETYWPASTFLATASILVRKITLVQAIKESEVLRWRLVLGDTPLWLGLALISNAYYLDEKVSVYQRTGESICYTVADKIGRDATIARLWYFSKFYKRPFSDLPCHLIAWVYAKLVFENPEGQDFRSCDKKCNVSSNLSGALHSRTFRILTMAFNARNKPSRLLYNRYVKYWLSTAPDPKWIKAECKSAGCEHNVYRKGSLLPVRICKLPLLMIRSKLLPWYASHPKAGIYWRTFKRFLHMRNDSQ